MPSNFHFRASSTLLEPQINFQNLPLFFWIFLGFSHIFHILFLFYLFFSFLFFFLLLLWLFPRAHCSSSSSSLVRAAAPSSSWGCRQPSPMLGPPAAAASLAAIAGRATPTDRHRYKKQRELPAFAMADRCYSRWPAAAFGRCSHGLTGHLRLAPLPLPRATIFILRPQRNAPQRPPLLARRCHGRPPSFQLPLPMIQPSPSTASRVASAASRRDRHRLPQPAPWPAIEASLAAAAFIFHHRPW